MAVKKYLDLVGLGEYHGQLKTKWFDKLDAVVNDSSQIINTTVLSGDPALPTGSTSSLEETNVVASTKWVYGKIAGITEPMIFKGGVTLTADSTDHTKCSLTITDPATATDIKKGYTYKVTSIAQSPAYTGTIKVGDTFIADKNSPAVTASWAEGTDWTVVPSGDDVDVTAVTAGTGLKIGDGTGEQTITSTGTINLKPATDSTIGGVKVAAVGTSNITLAGDGGISVATANASTLGLVKPDDSTIKINSNGALAVQPATSSVLGGVIDGDRVTIASNGTISADLASVTNSTAGAVLPDGTVITLNDSTGAITVPDATNSVKGVVTVDNTTITATNGNITAVTATAGTSADGTKGIVTTKGDTSALKIESGSIAVKLKSETIESVATTSLGIDSNGLYVDVITTADITNIVTPA